MKSSEFWYKNATFYEVNVRAFYDSNQDGHGDLAGLTSKLDYFQTLGINCLWLNPFYPSPLKDDGYDISDFRSIQSQFGTLDDLHHLVEEAHRRHIRIILDLVLNHTSDQHPWFLEAKKDKESPFHDYYVWSDTDQKYKDARIIFIDTESSNWTWNETTGEYYWHRFYTSQPDLNYDNPRVRQEMMDVMRFWLDAGIDGFRADAIPYLFEREGTICENLPETHQYLKELRKLIETEYPGRILLCEANQWPKDVRPYFGDGDEFHMGFHFPLMPRIFISIGRGDATSLKKILEDTPSIPAGCQWCTFLRNHDELTLEMVTEEEREWLWSHYAPDDRMRLNLGIRRRLAPLLDGDKARIELANSLLFSLPGSPIVYYGDEIGMGDNIWLPDRNGVRTPMQWTSGRNAGFSGSLSDDLYSPVIDDPEYGPKQVNVETQLSDPESIFHRIQGLIAVRNEHPALQEGSFSWVETSSGLELASYIREQGQDRILVLNNLTPKSLRGKVTIPVASSIGERYIHGNGQFEVDLKNSIVSYSLPGYGYLWIAL